jgi:anti-sigma regulatory factor (Ser/Thr protein kinase)
MEQAMGAGDSGARSLVLTYPAVPQSVAAIRAALARFARNSGAPSRIAEAVALGASKAATNVVIHAYRDSAEPGHIEVIGALAADELVITVRDAGGGLRPRSDSPGLGSAWRSSPRSPTASTSSTRPREGSRCGCTSHSPPQTPANDQSVRGWVSRAAARPASPTFSTTM